MQTPPGRKGPYTKSLKQIHTEQIARLQAKNQHECDLLDDIRSYTKQRSTIEKNYAEALLKISNNYLNKKIPSIPDLRIDDEEERWNVWNVWRTVLEENEKLGRARLAAVEVFQQQITDDAKQMKQLKVSGLRRNLDQLQSIQKEVQTSVAELDRQKKLYFEEEHVAHDVRDKAREVEEKLKKKKGSIFSSLSSLQRSSVKLSSKKEQIEEKSTGARNEYILALAIANAHQDHYFNVDLDGCIKNLEAECYDKLKEYLMTIGRTELLTCSAAQTSFNKIKEQAEKLTRDYNVTCCVQYYPVLKQHIAYPFEPCDGDHNKRISCQHGARDALSHEAKKWASVVKKEYRKAREAKAQLQHHIVIKDNHPKPESEECKEIESKIDEFKEMLRKAETEIAKATGVLECLRDGDVNVDEFIGPGELNPEMLSSPPPVQKQVAPAPAKNGMGKGRAISNDTADFQDSEISDKEEDVMSDSKDVRNSESGSMEQENTGFTDPQKIYMMMEGKGWNDPTQVDWGDDQTDNVEPMVDETQVNAQYPEEEAMEEKFENQDLGWSTSAPISPPANMNVRITKCVALYTYNAQNADELSIVENEHLELIGDGDGDGWLLARNYKGEEGYVPQNYVEEETEMTDGYQDDSDRLRTQISFSSVDYYVDSKTPDTKVYGAHESISNQFGVTKIQEEEVPVEEETLQATGNEESVDVLSSGLTTPFINELKGQVEGSFCRALYDYEAQNPEELSFYEGQIIKIIRMNEEDGWWEGEFDNKAGVFPSIVVQECTWDGSLLSPDFDEGDVEMLGEDEEDISDSGIAPPPFAPPTMPPDIVTETKEAAEVQACEESGIEDTGESPPNAFHIELNGEAEESNKFANWTKNDFSDDDKKEDKIDPEVEKEEKDSLGASLEVAQIVITAATPVCEEKKCFPANDTNDNGYSEVMEEDQETGEQPFEDAEVSENVVVEMPTPEEVEEKEQNIVESRKTAEGLRLDEEKLLQAEKTIGVIASPLTPEELDLNNLAKLESLKESDA